MSPEEGLKLAAAYAATTRPDPRNFRLGAMAVRGDGAIVFARNASAEHPLPEAHAEARIARKIDTSATIWVARILRADGVTWAMAKPCIPCFYKLRARRVKRIYYTISANHYGCILLA